MTRRGSPIKGFSLGPRQAAALFAVLALLLRPAAPMPTEMQSTLALAGLFGEHALCLAGLADHPAGPSQREPSPAAPSDHAGHDGLGCCAWHAGSFVLLPGESPLVSPAVMAWRAVAIGGRRMAPPRLAGPAQARAPPRSA